VADITLEQSFTIIRAALRYARDKSFKPLAVMVLDARGAPKAFAAEDETSLKRAEIAQGKANAVLSLGLGGRELDRRARERPHFMNAVSSSLDGPFVPVPGGVLIKNQAGKVLGAVGVSGDTSENDEEAALAGIEAAELAADTGAGAAH
jgi:uncharacterized protein GlcG (DUF336 family)